MRREGRIPAVLYGHGEETVLLSVSAAEVHAAIRRGSRLVDLVGEMKESALIRDVHWDAFGTDVLHIDFTRASATEEVEVTVPVQLRGDAPGSHQGGIVDQSCREVDIACPAGALPEVIEVSVNELELGQSIVASQLELPEKARLLTDPETTVVQCIEPLEELEEEEEAAVPSAGEPEVIGRKPDEEEGESGS